MLGLLLPCLVWTSIFNGWGNKQSHANDAKVAAHVAGWSGAPYVKSTLVMEGGSVEVDGEGTASSLGVQLSIATATRMDGSHGRSRALPHLGN